MGSSADLVPFLLRARQDGRSQRAFARHLGISQTLLNFVLNGKRRFGPVAARRILAVYPELRPLLAEAVLETPADGPLGQAS